MKIKSVICSINSLDTLPSNCNKALETRDFPTAKGGKLKVAQDTKINKLLDDTDHTLDPQIKTQDASRQLKVKLFCGALHEDEVRKMPKDLLLDSDEDYSLKRVTVPEEKKIIFSRYKGEK